MDQDDTESESPTADILDDLRDDTDGPDGRSDGTDSDHDDGSPPTEHPVGDENKTEPRAGSTESKSNETIISTDIIERDSGDEGNTEENKLEQDKSQDSTTQDEDTSTDRVLDPLADSLSEESPDRDTGPSGDAGSDNAATDDQSGDAGRETELDLNTLLSSDAESQGSESTESSILDSVADSVTDNSEASEAAITDTPKSDITDEATAASDNNSPVDEHDSASSAGITDKVESGEQVFLLGPVEHTHTTSTCIDLATSNAEQSHAVIFVTVTESPQQRLETWQAHHSGESADLRFINVGSDQQITEESVTTELAKEDVTVGTEVVADASDLSRLGMTISRAMSEWDESPMTPTLCLHSMSALLQYVTTQELFQFLHVLTERVQKNGGLGHYHMDPGIHEERTIATFRPLFSTTIRVDDEGPRIDSL